MNITPKFREWLITNCDVKADATDDEFRKAAGNALADGTLSAVKLIELSKDPKADEANEFSQKLDSIASGLDKLVGVLSAKEETKTKTEAEKTEAKVKAEEKEAEEKAKAKEAESTTKVEPSMMAKMIATLGGTPDENDDGDEEKSLNIRVKEAAENYSTTKTAMVYPAKTNSEKPHPFAGHPVKSFANRSRIMNEPSERDKAVIGAYCKYMCSCANLRGSRTFGFQSLPQHDKELLLYGMQNMEWNGSIPGDDYADIESRKLTSREQKALIDDATSGGLEAAPIVFDDDVIQTPLLHGELFPLVNQVILDRGRRIEAVSMGTVTGTWGGVDDTAISLFNTSSYVSAFDTTIYRWQGAIRIGLDFLSDTPIDFGRHITTQYGERLLEDLDDVIAVGDGNTQPEGVVNKSGITTVSWGGSTSIGNYESLRFAVAKPEHRSTILNSAVFCGTETSYERAKGIPVGAADNRRLFGEGGMGTEGYDNYKIMGRSFKINESLANTQVWYAILARYRMYVRRGLTIRTSTEGDTLIRNNEMLITVTARYGGQLERAAVGALTTTAPS